MLTQNTTISSLIPSRSYLGSPMESVRDFLERGKMEREILGFVVEGEEMLFLFDGFSTCTNLENESLSAMIPFFFLGTKKK